MSSKDSQDQDTPQTSDAGEARPEKKRKGLFGWLGFGKSNKAEDKPAEEELTPEEPEILELDVQVEKPYEDEERDADAREADHPFDDDADEDDPKTSEGAISGRMFGGADDAPEPDADDDLPPEARKWALTRDMGDTLRRAEPQSADPEPEPEIAAGSTPDNVTSLFNPDTATAPEPEADTPPAAGDLPAAVIADEATGEVPVPDPIEADTPEETLEEEPEDALAVWRERHGLAHVYKDQPEEDAPGDDMPADIVEEAVDEAAGEDAATPLDEVLETGDETDTPRAEAGAAAEELPADEDDLPPETEIEAEPRADLAETPEEDTDEDEAVEPAPVAEEKPEKKKGFFSRLKAGLSRSTNAISDGITGIFTKAKLDDEKLEELEDLLIASDLGVEIAGEVTADLARSRYNKDISPREVREELARIIAARMEPVVQPLEIDSTRMPHVILVVGVNGTGKTTTIGKLAHRFTQEGKSVMLAAGDTFRAAAIDQLKIWGDRTGSPVVARDVGADSAGLAYDALRDAREGGHDVLMIDTAGRLQNKQGLMDELAKVIRVLKKQDPDAPHSVLLVLDATTGQNAISQVDVFKDVAGVTGLVMTKLDGTARGGILVSLAAKFGLPIHAIGVGETIEDFQAFEAEGFARALTGADEDAD